MRISGGRARGIPLRTGDSELLRPATDRLREAVFSSLGPLVEGAHVLDAFAGTGAYGLECLSRGASSATFLENDRLTLAHLDHNLRAVAKSLGVDPSVGTIVPGDLVHFSRDPGRWSLIFIDPPFRLLPARFSTLFAWARTLIAPHPDARLIFEMPGELHFLAPEWELLRRLGKGTRQPTAALYRPVVADPPPSAP